MNCSTLPSGWLNSPYYIGELSHFFSIENCRHMQYCYIMLIISESKINFQTFVYIFLFLPNLNIMTDISKIEKNGSTLLHLPYWSVFFIQSKIADICSIIILAVGYTGSKSRIFRF